MRIILARARELSIERAVSLGDEDVLYRTESYPDTEKIFDQYRKWIKEGRNLRLVPGNHDHYFPDDLKKHYPETFDAEGRYTGPRCFQDE